MSKKVYVDLDDRGYDITIGCGVKPGTALAESKPLRILIVSDNIVDGLYGDKCAAVFTAMGHDVRRAVVPYGEASKDLKFVQQLYGDAVRAGLDRSSVIVALGGGVVGDLAGFVAATFLRGIRFIQVPTSLLAMVDSSVGGKTGVNLPEGKNLVGAFYQPIEVSVDLATLKTLPRKEYLSGLAEVVKYGVIWDAKLFSLLENNVQKLLDRDLEFLEGIVVRCCEIKGEVVGVDEKETGVRAILNFGHTMGHAIEKVIGYGRWMHGEAVAAGMVFASRLSVEERHFPLSEHERLRKLIESLGLPAMPEEFGLGGAWKTVRDAMTSDKKSKSGVPRFVLVEKLGAVVFDCEVSETALEKVFLGDW